MLGMRKIHILRLLLQLIMLELILVMLRITLGTTSPPWSDSDQVALNPSYAGSYWVI